MGTREKYEILNVLEFASSRDRIVMRQVLVCLQMGTQEKYEILNVLEFTSTRKRMSVVVRMPDKSLLLMMKGAVSNLVTVVLQKFSYCRFQDGRIALFGV